MADLDAIVDDVRVLLGDDGIPRSHIVLIGLVNGTNVRFQSQHYPLDTSAALYTGDGVLVSTGYTFDPDTGVMVFDTAPDIGDSHYLEGSVYAYLRSRILSCVRRAGQELYGVWGTTKCIVSGAGESLDLVPEPADNDYALLTLLAAMRVLGGVHAAAAAHGIRSSGPSGTMDTTSRAPELRLLVTELVAQANQIIADAGYNLPKFLGIDYSGYYEGQVLVAEPDGVIE